MSMLIRILAVILTLLAVLPVAVMPVRAQEDSRRIETIPDSDYFGYDLRTVQNIGIEDCKAICLGDNRCKAFTYNVKAQWCFLKSDFDQLNSFVGAIAGRVVTGESTEPDIGKAPELAFVPAGTRADAAYYRETNAISHRDVIASDAGFFVESAKAATADGDPGSAIRNYAAAVAADPDRSSTWLGLARSALDFKSGDSTAMARTRDLALSAALSAYQTSRTETSRAEALAVLGQAFERSEMWRPALNSWRASLDMRETPALRAAYADLRARKGFRVVDNTVDADSATPRICVQFSETLESGVDYSSFVTITEAPDAAIETEARQICVDGLEHGKRYTVGLRQGLPSRVGEKLEAPVELTIYVRDRAPAARFSGNSFVLPAKARHGIPLVTINAPVAHLKLYRIGDRGLTGLLSGSRFLGELDSYSASRIVDETGEPVWSGDIEIGNEPNREVTTSIPVDEILPEREAGVYVLTATPEGDKSEGWQDKATQWFVVSDIGISTFAGTDGLSIFLRSLETAQPLEGVSLTLLARNNEILGTATTDADGRSVFTAGLIRGTGGLAPAVLIARNGEDDFVFLDLTKGGFDLSDRGVTGRPAPGGIDVMSWTERGIYRPGETVHLSALARDDISRALDDLPLTVVLQRPDGVEDRRVVSSGEELGGHAVDFDIPTNAMTGTWQARIFTDPEGDPLAVESFLVEDFQPDRIEFDLNTSGEALSVDNPVTVEVYGRYLYGAPAAGLDARGEVTITRMRTHPDHPRYQFGIEDEAVQSRRFEIAAPEPLDADGHASIDVSIDEPLGTTQFSKAEVTVRLAEEGGRAVERQISLDIVPDGPRIGIAPQFEGRAPENSAARFRLIAVAPDGSRIGMNGVDWSLVKVERHYQWYRVNNSWDYEAVSYSTEIADGEIDLGTEDPAEIEIPVGWGRYRLDVAGADGTESSLMFSAGWYVEATSTETPDGLEIALDKDSYAVGETAKLHISPRFAGEVLVTVGSDRLVSVHTAPVSEDGTTIELPVTGEWGGGAYVTATLYRPASESETRMPKRAIGVKWASVAPGERKLEVSLDVPEQGDPRAPLVIPVALAGFEPGTEAFVSVAAVDVGILNLTRHEPADPEAWYFGQRALGLEIRDIYGQLIDGYAGVTGRIRTGGDGMAMRAEGSPPKEDLVAFFEGPVRVGEDGTAEVTFDMPQFNGTVRVSAVAWSEKAVGHAQKDVIIRDPVVITASMPQFLAPGDQSRLLLQIANTDGPAGAYRLSATSAEGGVEIDTAGENTFDLTEGGRTTLSLPLSGVSTGEETITIALGGPEGLSVTRTEEIEVRPAAMPVTTRRIVSLSGNGGSLRIDGELLADSLLDGASVNVGVSRNAAFDIGALLMALDRYPYGCAEQTTSRALPLLYLSELDRGGAADDAETRKRIENAITRLVSFQSSSGSFGMWGPGSGDLWLDAYVTDFLTRAQEQGYEVPPQASRMAIDNLQNALAYTTDLSADGSGIAYALYVLARNRKASVSDLRYYSDNQIGSFRTPMARAQIAAALALYGDSSRAAEGFRSAFTHAKSTSSLIGGRADYGSGLRDGAGILALAAESTSVPKMVPDLIDYVGEQFQLKRHKSTQENLWMVLAARALVEANHGISLSIDGADHEGGFSRRLSGEELLASPLTLVNRGGDPVDAVVTTIAAPRQPLSAGGNGYTIARNYYTLEGEPVSISEVRQNERFVVVLEMSEANSWRSRVIVTDLLPAGLAIDNPRLVGSADISNMDWLGKAEAAHVEFRKDRFVAAFDRSGDSDRNFRVAYVVRAVTPGVYKHPAAVVEDMYRPELNARTAAGMMEVQAGP